MIENQVVVTGALGSFPACAIQLLCGLWHAVIPELLSTSGHSCRVESSFPASTIILLLLHPCSRLASGAGEEKGISGFVIGTSPLTGLGDGVELGRAWLRFSQCHSTFPVFLKSNAHGISFFFPSYPFISVSLCNPIEMFAKGSTLII